jgi:hypothetical protein
MTNWREFGAKYHGLIKVLSQHLPGRTEENHETPQILTELLLSTNIQCYA